MAQVGARTWSWIVLLGLIGQVAWAVENMYLNVFVHETITDNPQVLALLVSTSAVAATVATLLVGAASDRRGRRREFIAIGYVLWGITTAGFGLISPQSAGELGSAQNAVAIAVVSIVLLDCVMSFLGSGANDAAFQAWVTDNTVPANRAKVDGVIQAMPLLAMLLVFGALDPLTQDGAWGAFFAVVGGVTAVVGAASWWGLRGAEAVPRPSGSYLSSVLHGLRPSTVRGNPWLYYTLAAWAVLGVSFQVFLPYLIIYVEKYLGIEGYALVLACVLIGASVLSILGGRLLAAHGVLRALPIVVVGYVTGLLAMFVARAQPVVILAGIAAIGGFLVAVAGLSATVRNLTPADRVGQVQGLRMIAAVLVPSVIGPFIGAAVISGADETYVDLGVTKQVPTPWIFIAAAVVALLVVLPLRALQRAGVKQQQETAA
ncbi:MFS transporter [Nocardioides dubius]|uniref:Major facilitator superfamily (MFS) profile domain-containing protein n=1 Tax=Nocardioides dubius TaxID=317019 RepID=A0ABP4EJQ3_9ACTN